MSHSLVTKNDFLRYFQSLEKKYLSLGGKEKIELVVVGGGSIVFNYSFRKSTTDIDALYKTNNFLEKAIKEVAEKENLPLDWLNDEFTITDSFTEKLIAISTNTITTKNDVFKISFVKDEYLIAMKIKSRRATHGDIRDARSLIAEIRYFGREITFEEIEVAYEYLYNEKIEDGYYLKGIKEYLEMPIDDLKELVWFLYEIR